METVMGAESKDTASTDDGKTNKICQRDPRTKFQQKKEWQYQIRSKTRVWSYAHLFEN